MLRIETMTRHHYSCDVWGCEFRFSTFTRAWAYRRGWKEEHVYINDEGPWDGLHILHFCPQHTLEDWL